MIFGLAAITYFVFNLVVYEDRVGATSINAGYLVGVGVAWWYLSDAFVVGFGLKWGRWPRTVAIPVALVLAVISLVVYQHVWAPPLAWGVYIMSQFFYGFIGPSFILAAIFAVPG